MRENKQLFFDSPDTKTFLVKEDESQDASTDLMSLKGERVEK